MEENNHTKDLAALVEKEPIQAYPATNRKRELRFLVCLFLFGVLLGSLGISFGGESVVEAVKTIFLQSIHFRATSPFLNTLFSSAASSYLFLIAIFLSGLTVWGEIAERIFPLLRGIGVGVIAGYIYSFGLKGVFYYACICFPGMMLSSICIIWSCCRGVEFSKEWRMMRYRQKRKEGGTVPSVLDYWIQMGAISMLAIIAALLDAVIALYGSGFFLSFLAISE